MTTRENADFQRASHSESDFTGDPTFATAGGTKRPACRKTPNCQNQENRKYCTERAIPQKWNFLPKLPNYPAVSIKKNHFERFFGNLVHLAFLIPTHFLIPPTHLVCLPVFDAEQSIAYTCVQLNALSTNLVESSFLGYIGRPAQSVVQS
jgi:hypothetical protein